MAKPEHGNGTADSLFGIMMLSFLDIASNVISEAIKDLTG